MSQIRMSQSRMAQGRILQQFFMSTRSVIVFALLSNLSGCFVGENASTGAGIGAVTGAGAGAVLGNQTGQVGRGAALGAASGTIIGGLAGGAVDAGDQEERNKKKRDELLDFQQREYDRQYREVEDLRRQQYEDQEFRRKYGDAQ